MNRIQTTIAFAITILLTFIVPVALVHRYEARVDSYFVELQKSYASEIVAEERAVSKVIAASTKPKPTPVQRAKTASKTSAQTVSWSSPLPKVATAAEAYPILEKIANCESESIATAKNPNSSAKGLLQILDSTWDAFSCKGDPYNPDDNMQCGIKIATQSGFHHWNPSRACWAPLIKNTQLSTL